ncbi:MAG TPA: glycosyltransferase family 4 protein [Candidatus Peribacteraceae bacterium]|nr:glycosyltransferase family 4 protein [Candidatus Peribacteraceae bacterium]
MKRLLSIARTTGGFGGMQRLQSDLDRALENVPDIIYVIVRPFGTLLDPTFLFRALLHARGSVVHLGDASLVFLIPLLRLCGAQRIIVTACGLDVVYDHALYQRYIRMLLKKADHVIAISRATAAQVVHRGANPRNVSVIPCGIVDVRGLTSGTGLLSVCRLVPRKGIAWFLEHVFPIVLAQDPAVRWTIVGDGPELVCIEQLRTQLKLESSVTILGSVSEEKKQKIFSVHSVFLMPNIPVPGNMEGFGITCIEASARGLSVAAARLEGIQDAVLEARTGIFFRPSDAEDAARVVLSLLRNPLPPANVSRETKESFSWRHLMPQYMDIFFPHS